MTASAQPPQDETGEALSTTTPSPNTSHHDSVSTYRHLVCDDCGRAYHAHDKTRVYDEDGRWSYDYTCPEGDA